MLRRRMKPILCAGLVCLDQVTVVTTFPVEDTDQRSVAQYKVGQVRSLRIGVKIRLFQSRGGNANNSCTVLSHLGLSSTFLGTFARDLDGQWLRQSLLEDGVEVGADCPEHSGYVCPNSVVLSNTTTGSRTIIHTNLGLPELSLQHFKNIKLDDFRWEVPAC